MCESIEPAEVNKLVGWVVGPRKAKARVRVRLSDAMVYICTFYCTIICVAESDFFSLADPLEAFRQTYYSTNHQ